MKIAIASGKGGTGKSTVATNFAYLLSQIYDDFCLLDCDVEEPNCHIFLKPEFKTSKQVFVETPEINEEKCVKCGKCAEVCQYNALAFVNEKVLVFPELCHGCGNCGLACPVDAIGGKGREVGVVEDGTAQDFRFVHGKSRIGEAMAPPLIKAVKKAADAQNHQVQVLDCPPGTSCPAIAAVHATDYVFMVTEPTPFGLYDLSLGVDVIRKMGLKFGIIINRSGENDKIVEKYAEKEGIDIIARIPDERRIAEFYSKGEIIVKALPEIKEAFEPLVKIVKEGV